MNSSIGAYDALGSSGRMNRKAFPDAVSDSVTICSGAPRSDALFGLYDARWRGEGVMAFPTRPS